MGVRILVLGPVFFSQVGLVALAQVDIIPEGLGNLLQLPILAAFIWLTVSFLKWHHEQMKMLLEANKEERKEYASAHQKSIEMLLGTQGQKLDLLADRVEQKMNKLADRSEVLTASVSVNTSQLALTTEAIRSGELMEEVKDLIIERIAND